MVELSTLQLLHLQDLSHKYHTILERLSLLFRVAIGALVSECKLNETDNVHQHGGGTSTRKRVLRMSDHDISTQLLASKGI